MNSDALNRLLEKIVSGKANGMPTACRSLPSDSASSSSDYSDGGYPFLDPLADQIWCERIDYHRLIRLGGRPLYPAEMIPRVARSREDHKELLRPIQGIANSIDSWVIQAQLGRWQEFQILQNQARGLEGDDELDFEVWNEGNDEYELKNLGEYQFLKWRAKMSANPDELQESWEFDKRLRKAGREWFRNRCQQHGAGDDIFQHYSMGVKARLADRGLSQPFPLDENPKNQDQLTTWIEYLAMEYGIQDELQQKDRDAKLEVEQAWKCIMDSRHWLPCQKTQKYQTGPASFHMRREEEEMEAILQSYSTELEKCKSRLEHHERLERVSRTCLKERVKQLELKVQETAERHKIAHELFEQCTRYRRSLLGAREALEKSSRLSLYVRWAEDQIPLIKAEIAPAAKSSVEHEVPYASSRSRSLSEPSVPAVFEYKVENEAEHESLLVQGLEEEACKRLSEEQTNSKKRKYSQDESENGDIGLTSGSGLEKRRRQSETHSPIMEKDPKLQEGHSSQDFGASVAASTASEAASSPLSEVPSEAFTNTSPQVRVETPQKHPKTKRKTVQPSQEPRRSARVAEARQKKEAAAAELAATASKASTSKSRPGAGFSSRRSRRVVKQDRTPTLGL